MSDNTFSSLLEENKIPIDGSYPEQKKKKFDTLKELIISLGVNPKDMSLYQMAFTHASYSNEHKDSKNYDRLEFLGDGVLDLVVGDLVYNEHKEFDSGGLSENRSKIVEGKNLSAIAIELGFAPYVRFSEGEKNNAAFHGHIFEDVFEAFIGAVYLENGYDFTFNFIKNLMIDYVKGRKSFATVVDWKSRLQEEIQAEFKSNIEYVVKQKSNVYNQPLFVAVCSIDGVILGTGEGRTKKQAETEAAKEALLARKRK